MSGLSSGMLSALDKDEKEDPATLNEVTTVYTVVSMAEKLKMSCSKLFDRNVEMNLLRLGSEGTDFSTVFTVRF